MTLNRVVSETSFKMFSFAFCPGLDTAEGDKLRFLGKRLAAEEQWFFEDQPSNKLTILYNYIHHTFNRVYDESKIIYSGDKEKCYFNTGLFTKHYEEIFGEFSRNFRSGAQPWYFNGFLVESNLALTTLPERANYFESISDIIFDYRLEVRINANHILDDTERSKRLPVELRNVQNLNGAVQMTIRRIKTNYRLAVPQYYFGTGKIQLLIPLFSSDPEDNTVKAVIPIEKASDGGVYLGRTCLDITQAYNNARLLAKLDSEWLTPRVNLLQNSYAETAAGREKRGRSDSTW